MVPNAVGNDFLYSGSCSGTNIIGMECASLKLRHCRSRDNCSDSHARQFLPRPAGRPTRESAPQASVRPASSPQHWPASLFVFACISCVWRSDPTFQSSRFSTATISSKISAPTPISCSTACGTETSPICSQDLRHSLLKQYWLLHRFPS